MADATDRPTSTTGASNLPAFRTPVPVPPPSESEPYKSLSLGALAGFALALIYAFIVLGGIVGAWFLSVPWLLPVWTIALPVFAALVCLAARQTIRASENTLGGAGLASYGIGISVFTAVFYYAYYAAVVFSVSGQADTFVQGQFLRLLKENKPEEAFLLTLAPPRPSVDPATLRQKVELTYNTPTAMSPGAFTMFSELDFVRILGVSGESAKITSRGSGTPVVDKGITEVPLIYFVETPLLSFELEIHAGGTDSKSRESSGRQWQILMNQRRTGAHPETRIVSDEGRRVFDKAQTSARQFTVRWAAEVAQRGNLAGGFAGTLPPQRRLAMAEKFIGKNEAELTKAATTDPDAKEFLDGVKAFREGSVVKVDKDVFWASDTQREDIIHDVKARFGAATTGNSWLDVSKTLPAWSYDDKKVQFQFDTLIQLIPKFVVGAKIIVEADSSVLDAEPATTVDKWRVVAVELIRGRSAPQPKRVGEP